MLGFLTYVKTFLPKVCGMSSKDRQELVDLTMVKSPSAIKMSSRDVSLKVSSFLSVTLG